jgi:ATP-dependent Clp protease ATP-binding subunit ClpC
MHGITTRRKAWGGRPLRTMKTTPRCQQALDYAKESLPRFGHSHVSIAHLVLGLLTLRGGVGDSVLRKFGFSVEGVEAYLSAHCSQATDSATAALERAEVEARARQHTYVGVEHLLLGILADGRGEAADLCASFHADPDSMRWIITEEIQ